MNQNVLYLKKHFCISFSINLKNHNLYRFKNIRSRMLTHIEIIVLKILLKKIGMHQGCKNIRFWLTVIFAFRFSCFALEIFKIFLIFDRKIYFCYVSGMRAVNVKVRPYSEKGRGKSLKFVMQKHPKGVFYFEKQILKKKKNNPRPLYFTESCNKSGMLAGTYTHKRGHTSPHIGAGTQPHHIKTYNTYQIPRTTVY